MEEMKLAKSLHAQQKAADARRKMDSGHELRPKAPS